MKYVTKILSNTPWWKMNLKELFNYRELFWALAIRDIRVRYKQTVIGGAWAILQPFLTMIVFSFFFGKIAKIPSDGIPYPIFSYSGLLLWMFFTNTISNVSVSMIGNTALITKVYFPRIIIPLSSTIITAVDYIFASLVMFVMLTYYQIPILPRLILVPLVVLMTWFLASGIGLFLAAINVRYRDIRYALPFFIQLMVFVTPVIYPASVSGKYNWIIMLNPMSGLIEAHRALILGHQMINLSMLGVSLIFTLVIFILGIVYFRKVERYFADII